MNNAARGQQPQMIQFDSNDCDRLVCRECGYDGFEFEYGIVEIPYIYRPVFQDQQYMNIQYYRCKECGHRHGLEELEKIEPKNKKMELGAVVFR